MITIFLTGGSGYLGNKFLNKLKNLNNDFKIISVSRKNIVSVTNIEELIADISDTHLFEKELMESDFIIWFAASRNHFGDSKTLYVNNILPIERATEILKRSTKLKRFIFISSISATDNEDFANKPIMDSTFPNPRTSYGSSKLQAEQIIRSSNCPFIILRLPFMYGSDFKPHSHLWFWLKISRIPYINFTFSKGRISLLHIDDLCDILLHVVLEKLDLGINSTHVLSDFKIYDLNEIIGLLRNNIKPNPSIKINLSGLMRFIYLVCPTKFVRYWTRLLFDRNAFTVQPSCEVLKNYKFLSLADGLSESFQMKPVIP